MDINPLLSTPSRVRAKRLAAVLLLLCAGRVSLALAEENTVSSHNAHEDAPHSMKRLLAAGSLTVAMTELINAWSEQSGNVVEADFAPSGLLRKRIEAGEPAHIFASANMRHPETLHQSGLSGPVVMFARNQLCALTAPGLNIASADLLPMLLDESIRVATSTPGADPSGDYAFALFAKAEQLHAGAQQILETRSLQLTGGPDSKPAPEGRNTYAWVMETGQADIFLTYCTNAVLACKEVPGLGIVTVPDALAVGADYGLTVLKGAPESASDLALHILSPARQAILADYGFSTVTLPR